MSKDMGVCFCGNHLESFETHPAIFDPIIKSWALDENGVIRVDTTKPKIKVPVCHNHNGGKYHAVFL